MWSSVTERRIGTAGVSSTGVDGSSVASPRSVSKTDWISAADVAARDGVVADMRRHDLGGEGEELASIDGLVFGHARPLQKASSPEVLPQLRLLSSNAQALRPQAVTAPGCKTARLRLVMRRHHSCSSFVIAYGAMIEPTYLSACGAATRPCTSRLDLPVAPCGGPLFSGRRRIRASDAHNVHPKARPPAGLFLVPRRTP